MSPRPLDDGAKVGWGLVAFISSVFWAMVAAVLALIAWAWERYRKT